MSIVYRDTEAPSCAPTFYKPPRLPRRNVLASVALACVIGVALSGVFFLGLSGGLRP